jgi:hypothetical protein
MSIDSRQFPGPGRDVTREHIEENRASIAGLDDILPTGRKPRLGGDLALVAARQRPMALATSCYPWSRSTPLASRISGRAISSRWSAPRAGMTRCNAQRLLQGLRLQPTNRAPDLESGFRCPECDARGKGDSRIVGIPARPRLSRSTGPTRGDCRPDRHNPCVERPAVVPRGTSHWPGRLAPIQPIADLMYNPDGN